MNQKLTEIEWVCIRCNEVNLDDYEWTSQPVCADCGVEVDWDAILTRDEMDRLNAYLEEQEDDDEGW